MVLVAKKGVGTNIGEKEVNFLQCQILYTVNTLSLLETFGNILSSCCCSRSDMCFQAMLSVEFSLRSSCGGKTGTLEAARKEQAG